jgi:hypothetical protein
MKFDSCLTTITEESRIPPTRVAQNVRSSATTPLRNSAEGPHQKVVIAVRVVR